MGSWETTAIFLQFWVDHFCWHSTSWGQNGGTPKRVLQNFWINIFLKLMYEKSNIFQSSSNTHLKHSAICSIGIVIDFVLTMKKMSHVWPNWLKYAESDWNDIFCKCFQYFYILLSVLANILIYICKNVQILQGGVWPYNCATIGIYIIIERILCVCLSVCASVRNKFSKYPISQLF